MNSIQIDGQTLNLIIAFGLGFGTYMAFDALIILTARFNSYFRRNFLAGVSHIITPAAERTYSIGIGVSVVNNNDDGPNYDETDDEDEECDHDDPDECENNPHCDI